MAKMELKLKDHGIAYHVGRFVGRERDADIDLRKLEIFVLDVNRTMIIKEIFS